MNDLLGFIVAKRNTAREMRGHVVTPEGRTFLIVDFGYALWLDRQRGTLPMELRTRSPGQVMAGVVREA